MAEQLLNAEKRPVRAEPGRNVAEDSSALRAVSLRSSELMLLPFRKAEGAACSQCMTLRFLGTAPSFSQEVTVVASRFDVVAEKHLSRR